MIVVANPEDQVQFNEILQEIKNISREIQEDSENGNPRYWKLKMNFSMIRELVWQAEALLKEGNESAKNDF